MSEGTLITLWANRVHKSNCREVAEDAGGTMGYIERRLLAMAAASPEPAGDGCLWYEHVSMEVPQMLEEYGEQAVRRYLAEGIQDSPEDARDELVEEDWPCPDTLLRALAEDAFKNGGALWGLEASGFKDTEELVAALGDKWRAKRDTGLT